MTRCRHCSAPGPIICDRCAEEIVGAEPASRADAALVLAACVLAAVTVIGVAAALAVWG